MQRKLPETIAVKLVEDQLSLIDTKAPTEPGKMAGKEPKFEELLEDMNLIKQIKQHLKTGSQEVGAQLFTNRISNTE